jgi:hypothetical protein
MKVIIFFTANELVLQTSIYQCFLKFPIFLFLKNMWNFAGKKIISQIFSKVIKKITAQVQTHVLQRFEGIEYHINYHYKVFTKSCLIKY